MCTAKKTINKTKRQPSEWGGTLTNKVTEEGINFQNIQTAYAAQQQKQTPNQKKKKKWTEDLNRHFSKINNYILFLILHGGVAVTIAAS